jgi:hypothetical protein
MGDDDADYALALIMQRCPEAIDYVVSFEIAQRIVEVVDALAERMLALEKAVDGRLETEDAQAA